MHDTYCTYHYFTTVESIYGLPLHWYNKDPPYEVTTGLLPVSTFPSTWQGNTNDFYYQGNFLTTLQFVLNSSITCSRPCQQLTEGYNLLCTVSILYTIFLGDSMRPE